MAFKTADICDQNPHKVTVAKPIGFTNYGAHKQFHGMVRTLKCYEDHSPVEEVLKTNGHGKVLVVDGGGSLACALIGDRLGGLAVKNNWKGIIINGALRDSARLKTLPIGVLALATFPISKITDKNWNDCSSVQFAGATFSNGGYVYSDEDGLITSKQALL